MSLPSYVPTNVLQYMIECSTTTLPIPIRCYKGAPRSRVSLGVGR